MVAPTCFGITLPSSESGPSAGKQKEVHRTPLIWRLQAPDQGSTVGGLLLFPRLKSITKGARFADVAAIDS
jgi:hypothetical protein